MTKAKTRVVIIIPAYNEATVIGSVIRDTITTFKRTEFAMDVIVVDDGSSDTTAAVAHKSGAHVIRHILNSGSGAATATGLSFADAQNYDIAATIDADGQHMPSDVLKGIRQQVTYGGDLLIGSRVISVESEMSLLKKVGNKGLSLITYFLFGINVTDSQSGMRIFSDNALKHLRWKTSGYEFCSEMLWRAKQLSLTIGEFPIEVIYTDYSTAKGQSNWNGFNIVKLLLRQRIVEFFSE